MQAAKGTVDADVWLLLRIDATHGSKTAGCPGAVVKEGFNRQDRVTRSVLDVAYGHDAVVAEDAGARRIRGQRRGIGADSRHADVGCDREILRVSLDAGRAAIALKRPIEAVEVSRRIPGLLLIELFVGALLFNKRQQRYLPAQAFLRWLMRERQCPLRQVALGVRVIKGCQGELLEVVCTLQTCRCIPNPSGRGKGEPDQNENDHGDNG
jgi:hypothetical protein